MKTKWNWGTKLVLWITAFVVFILILVYTTFKYEVNLVEKDYYPKGLVYQTRINAIENATKLGAKFNISQDDNNLTIQMSHVNADSGSVLFFRPSDNTWDRTFDIVKAEGNTFSIPKDKFTKGKYIIKSNWWYNNNEYYVEQIYTVK